MSSNNFDFPDPLSAPDEIELIAVGQYDLTGEPILLTPKSDWPKLVVDGSHWDQNVILAAYRSGLFPMPLDAKESPLVISWWSPNPRGVIDPNSIKISKSLRKSIKRFKYTVDRNFEKVIRLCGDENRPAGWITENVVQAYLNLHRNGYAHSIEVWNSENELVGGLYGIELGGLFAGESMFHLERDASKAALVHLGQLLAGEPKRLIDCQWLTDHLHSLGAFEISRESYISGLNELLAVPPVLSRPKDL